MKRMKLKIASAFLALIIISFGLAGFAHATQATQRPDGAPAGAAASSARDARKKAHHDLLVEWFADVRAGKTGNALRWEYFAPRFMKEAEENADDFVGWDALGWIVGQGKVNSREFNRAVALLAAHHAAHEGAGGICPALNAPRYFAGGSGAIEGLLRQIMSTHPQAGTRAEACFCLSEFLFNKAEFARVMRRPEAADLARRIGACWGQDFLTRLSEVDPDELDRQAAKLFALGRAIHARYWANHVLPGKSAPQTRGEDLAGKFMALSDFRGNVTVLAFWAPWCIPCMAAVPEERARVRRLAGQPFVMLGVCGQDDRARIMRTIRDAQITWRSWPDADPQPNGQTIAALWDVHAWGESFILDRQGTIRYVGLAGANMDLAIDSLLISH